MNAIYEHNKEDAECWRPNPDAPERVAAIEVRILVEDWEEQRTKVTESGEAKGQFTVDVTTAQAFASALGGQLSASSVDPAGSLAIQDVLTAAVTHGLPCVPKAAAAGQDSTGEAPPVPGQPKTMEQHIREAQAKADRLAAERMKQQADAKEDCERKKDDPVEQAQKLAQALQKELATLHVMQLDVAGSRATNDQKTLYKKKFETFGKELTKATEKLLKANATNADDCMQE